MSIWDTKKIENYIFPSLHQNVTICSVKICLTDLTSLARTLGLKLCHTFDIVTWFSSLLTDVLSKSCNVRALLSRQINRRIQKLRPGLNSAQSLEYWHDGNCACVKWCNADSSSAHAWRLRNSSNQWGDIASWEDNFDPGHKNVWKGLGPLA